MQTIGVMHSNESIVFKKTMKYLSRLDWKGKTVGIEYMGKIDNLRRELPAFVYRPITQFWSAVVKLIENRGGKIVLINHQRLDASAILEWDIFSDKRHETSFRRTLRYIHSAKKQGVDVFITGNNHAYHIKKILGRKANVRMITPPGYWQEKSDISLHIKNKLARRKARTRTYEQLFAPALRNESKLKRPRMRSMLRRRKK